MTLLFRNTNAQVDSLKLTLDNIFAHIDKSQVPTGFLKEYGAEFVNLPRFNGILTDSNYVNALAWNYIYASVYSSKIYGVNTLPTPENNYTVINSEAVSDTGINPVSILALRYSSLKPDAVTNNLFTISNNQLYDVPGRQQSPYQLNTAFAAAPFFEVDGDGVLQLLFKQNLFINNTGKTVSNIQVNFDDGNGFETATWNNVVSTSYIDTGIKKLTIKLNFTDATNLQCYSNVRILKAAGGMMRYQPTTETISFEPVNNNHSGGDITVQYSVNNTTPIGNRKFQKPLIVVEGFDMHDAAPLLMPDGYDYEDFWNEITLGNAFFNGNDFNYNLDDIAGYDLIFLNYRDGTDDILRNALLLEEVINWVNTNKATGASDNVVMGISMGGLVSRYCLAKMTKAGNDPQTRLLITHDSPHRGANIPLGAQYMINDFAQTSILGRSLQDWIPQLRQAVILQTRPATLQQLIVRNNPITDALEYNSFLAPAGPYRQMVTFCPSDIQPTYKFVATSQGSQCGIPVMAPSSSIAKTSGEAGFTFIFGAFGAKFLGELKINALPNGTSSERIAYFVIKDRIKIFWINITTTLLKWEHYSPTGILGWDGCPAGTQSISRGSGIGNIPPTWDSGPWFIPPFIFEYVYSFSGLQLAPEFSFLPTSSALDEENISATSLYGPHVGASYTPPADNTFLQSFVAQEAMSSGGINIYNVPHTEFSARNSKWMYNEMENITQSVDCDDYCVPNDELSIAGDDIFCTTSNNYTIPYLPAGSTVSWSVSSGIVTINSPNSPQTTLTKSSGGKFTLTAYITNPCGAPITISKQNITVGTPSPFLGGTFNDGGSGVNQPLVNTYNEVYHTTVYVSLCCTGSEFTWQENSKTGNVSWYHPAGPQGAIIYFGSPAPVYYGDNIGFSITRDNQCGIATENLFFFYAGATQYYMLAPNPVQSSLTITQIDQPTRKLSSGKKQPNIDLQKIQIIDKMGNVIMEKAYPHATKSATINTAGLRSDVYTLRLYTKENVETHKIVVQH